MTTTVICVTGEWDNGDLTDALDPTKITTYPASSATDALKRLRDESIECLISVVSLPDLDMRHFIELVNEDYPDLPIILFDDRGSNRHRAEAVPSTVTEVVNRSDLDTITDRVLEIVAKSKTRAAVEDHEGLKNAVLDIVRAVTTASSKAEIEEIIYNRLLVTDHYQFIWIGSYHGETDQFELHQPHTTLVAQSDLASLLGAPETEFLTDAVDQDSLSEIHGQIETRTTSAVTSAGTHPTQSLSTVAVPLGSDGSAHIVLLLSAPASRPIERAERVLLETLGRIIAFFLSQLNDREEDGTGLDEATDFEAFAAKLVHELRNPLGIASAYLEISRQDQDPEALEEVQRALNRLEYSIRNLSTLARTDVVSDATTRDLGEIAQAAWDRIQTTDASLIVETTTAITADDDLLEHLLSNLFRNAIRHAGDGVVIRVGTLENGFFVEDTGPGIPAEDRKKVFDQGYSTDDGLGIGLSIVKEITEAHDWSVNITEGGEGGARFEFRNRGQSN